MSSLPFPVAGGDYPADKFDPDYLYFLRHIRPDGNSYVLELPHDGASPPSVIKYDPPIANSDGECVSDPSPGRASINCQTEERDSSSVEAVAAPSWLDSLVDIDEDYRVFLQHTRVVNNRLKLEIGGVVVNYEPDPDSAQSGGSSGIEEEREAAIASSGKDGKGVDSDEPVEVISAPNACDWRADPTPGQKVPGEEDMGRHHAEPSGASSHRSHGVIWPAHITNRPDSDFKRRLVDALCKPFSRKEYLNLFDMASIRTPLVKLRQVRNDEKFYPTDEMGNSYFDHYPDLVEQVTNTSYSKGLALMRGFFFWLQCTRRSIHAMDGRFKRSRGYSIGGLRLHISLIHVSFIYGDNSLWVTNCSQ
ncbi:uncharacterized protein LOC100822919 isoform X1 [Brachypodium distachyon]|nr:uncharacterized protein LOC100822919 isoform X1 [Brachypodium distachyon]|eukprot:XP_014751410.1 uncharacterized protein LOC100822919 isoform X1 [Brachypodium distachyon]